MDSQDGKGLLGLLFVVLIIFMIAWVATPWLQRVGKLLPDEEAAIDTLRAIHTAQQEHYGASRMYGSLRKLTNSKLMNHALDDFTSGGYVFSHSTNGRGSTWCATAVPEEGKPGRALGIDDSGAVWHGVSRGSCYMGSLATAGASPLR